MLFNAQTFLRIAEEISHMTKLGSEKATITTIFAYKINVAIALFILFLNIQNIVVIFFLNPPIEFMNVLISILLLLVGLAYGTFALNGFVTKIVINENGFSISNLFTEVVVFGNEIKKLDFHRLSLKKIKISITTVDGNALKINSSKYKDIEPLVSFLQKHKPHTDL